MQQLQLLIYLLIVVARRSCSLIGCHCLMTLQSNFALTLTALSPVCRPTCSPFLHEPSVFSLAYLLSTDDDVIAIFQPAM